MNFQRRNTKLAWLLLAVSIAALSPAYGATKVQTPAQDFTLTDQDGMPFRLSSLRGNVVLIFFGYTTCPDACPITMSKIASTYRHLGADAAHVRTVFISVDTQRDTPPVLKAYLSNFKSLNAIGLTGTVPQINKVVLMFGAAYEIVPMAGMPASHHMYTVAHSTSVYVLDAQGQNRSTFEYDASVEKMTDGIREALQPTVDR